ncbi:MAG: hypothetical protein E4H01_04490 [Lysobacterales bacterium]|nr:MAG: hypothetical protein E4H01_04490 [Xanthomonadales bacterium]
MKIDASAKDQILGALCAGADLALAGNIVGCTRQAIYKLRKRDPAFAELMDEARDLADEKVVRSLYEMATKGNNVTACIFWLKNRQPLKWRDRRDQDRADETAGALTRFLQEQNATPSV